MSADEGGDYAKPVALQEFVIRRLIPHDQVIYADSLENAGLKAKVILNRDETLVWVKTAAKFTADRAAGRRY